MARVITNNISLAYCVEASLGVLPAAPAWKKLQPNDISQFGSDSTETTRSPISAERQLEKGKTTDKNSAVEFQEDLTMQAIDHFGEGFVMAEYANTEFSLRAGGATPVPPPVASAATFTIDSASTTLAGKAQFVAGAAISLFYAKGYTNAANNGLHALTVDVAATDTTITFGGSTLVVETPPTSATLELCGIRSDDCTVTMTGSAITVASAADIDWTTTGIQLGQYVHLGSGTSTGAVQNAMTDAAANDTFGYFRVTAISATTLTGDKVDTNLGNGSSPYTPATLDVMFGRFLRNVAVSADATDERFLEQSYQFEGAYPDLGGVGTDEYEYPIGNMANTMTLDLPLSDKAGVTFAFVGTNTDDITASRKTNAASAVAVLRKDLVNTSADIASLSTDLLDAVGDVCFKSLSLSLDNGVNPEKCLGSVGASFMNYGNFTVKLDAQMLFTNKSIINAINNSTTVTFASILFNDDGALAIDIPSLTFSGGGKEFPVGQTVTVNLTGNAFKDATLDTSIGISLFPTVPTVR